MKIILISFFLGVIFLSSCDYNNEKDLYPSQLANCDTTNVTFNGTIIYILATNCFSCHDHQYADLFGDAVHLESYADVKSRLGKLSNAINHTGGVSSMPKNAAKLKACDLKKFEVWIRNDTPEE
ncbi:MAG: hypothetical protein Q8868_05760 [Bacteroidota bacterium]|nr:hypothetical protein [Bacteroidota bacterium]